MKIYSILIPKETIIYWAYINVEKNLIKMHYLVIYIVKVFFIQFNLTIQLLYTHVVIPASRYIIIKINPLPYNLKLIYIPV